MAAAPSRAPSSSALRDSLLDAAEAEIAELGAGGASLRAVARRAGVSHQAPAYVFSNRQGMLTALATRYVQRLEGRMREVATTMGDAPPLDRLVELGMTYVDFVQAHPALFSLTASPDQIDVEDGPLSEARQRAWSILHDVVAQAQETGWRADQPTAGIALACWVVVHGSAALWREGWLTAQFPESAVRELVRGLLLGLV